MKKFFKWTSIILGAVALLLLVGYAVVAMRVKARIGKNYSFAKEEIRFSRDSSTLARGRHLVAIKGCQDCHGSDLGGKVMNDDGALGRLVASNLTKGNGGLPQDYNTADWLAALRHGINHNGTPLIFMPSHETTLLSQQDMSALIAYCEQVPKIDRMLPTNELGPVAIIMTHFDKMPLLSVEKIDHSKPMIAKADTVTGAAQGKYLAVSCTGCHRSDLKGGEPLAPGFPPVPDITSSGHVGKWSEKDFLTTLTTGKTPEGHTLKNEDMPWKMTAQYTKPELQSLYRYLSSIR
ncbi:c-type cytochrome [Dyadobacter flavalbus]|uniref:C-type cytochrome n=1 Tax=Dyadobacter flavalbus TaxID=2579942 RepID=A0A5M8QQV7_9BACT|nr:c-type cytochrome [Dyadobacter flavalbus]KAA6436883.1 c-type cytochrome [Dyadobacter flavalbus]